MPLLAGTGQQAYLALLCFLTGVATAPLYEWTRPLKRKSKAAEFALDLCYMLAAGGIFLLVTHTALRGILSFYTAVSFFAGAAAGVFALRKTGSLLRKLFRPVIAFLKSNIVSEQPSKADDAEIPAATEKRPAQAGKSAARTEAASGTRFPREADSVRSSVRFRRFKSRKKRA